jgi:hypothetical protein
MCLVEASAPNVTLTWCALLSGYAVLISDDDDDAWLNVFSLGWRCMSLASTGLVPSEEDIKYLLSVVWGPDPPIERQRAEGTSVDDLRD